MDKILEWRRHQQRKAAIRAWVSSRLLRLTAALGVFGAVYVLANL